MAAAQAARAAASAAYQTGGIPSLTEKEEARKNQPASLPHSVPPYATAPPEPRLGPAPPARAALVGREVPVLRMDVGSSALPTIPLVQRFVFEAFARQNLSEGETDPRPEILQVREGVREGGWMRGGRGVREREVRHCRCGGKVRG